MKKTVKIIFAMILCTLSMFNFHAFALEEAPVEITDIKISQEEINEMKNKGFVYDAAENGERATGLIILCTISINDDFSLLQAVGSIECVSSVVKCGFKDIIVQKRASSSSSWVKHYQFDDELTESNEHSLVKAVTTDLGYQYRVVCTFYAKKNFFSVETITGYSNIMSW